MGAQFSTCLGSDDVVAALIVERLVEGLILLLERAKLLLVGHFNLVVFLLDLLHRLEASLAGA